MKIALIGYGKMGKIIESIATQKGHQISIKINSQNIDELASIKPENTDVAIEFSRPDLAVRNISHCLNNNIPIVCGTTGWLAEWNNILDLCKNKNGAFLYASNFSLGVNLFFELNKKLAKLLKDFPQYKPNIEEIHHTQKLDAPSGTAITLANGILSNIPSLKGWSKGANNRTDILPIYSKRIDPAPGTHTITYENAVDSIQISHVAHSREGFASGAVLAAEWLQNRKGVYSMKDLLGLT